MSGVVCSWFLLLVILSCAPVRGQTDCPEIQQSELGSTTTPSTEGLIADAVTLGDSGQAPNVLVLDSQTVCLAAGPTRDRYRFASVVVFFNCMGSLSAGNPLGIPNCNGNLTVQFDFECTDLGSGPEWGSAETLGGDDVFNPADGTLTTSLRTDCSFCADPAVGPTNGLTVDMATHCADCNSSCTGLMKCTGLPAGFCCNYYENDTCTLMCTNPLVPDANDDCVMDCGSLSNPTNGHVDFTTTFEGSTANYTCDTGYDLMGDVTRTCEADGQWSGSEPSCEIVDCGSGDLNDPTDGQVNFNTTTFNSTATYECDTGYNLQGMVTRTCQADGTWSGSEPTCQLPLCNITFCVSCSEPDKCETCEEGYILEMEECVEAPTSIKGSTGGDDDLIIGIIIGCVILFLLLLLLIIIIIIVAVYFWRKRVYSEYNVASTEEDTTGSSEMLNPVYVPPETLAEAEED